MTKKNKKKSKLEKYWEKTKKYAKIAQKEVVKAGKGLERVGSGLSAGGAVISGAFTGQKPTVMNNSQLATYPRNQMMTKENYIRDSLRPSRALTTSQMELIRRREYERKPKKLGFGFGGF